MNAIFIIPAMVSSNVNEKIIPALAKMIERNILLNNSALFERAARYKYSGAYNKNFASRMFRRESVFIDGKKDDQYCLYENNKIVKRVNKDSFNILEMETGETDVFYLGGLDLSEQNNFKIDEKFLVNLLEAGGPMDDDERKWRKAEESIFNNYETLNNNYNSNRDTLSKDERKEYEDLIYRTMNLYNQTKKENTAAIKEKIASAKTSVEKEKWEREQDKFNSEDNKIQLELKKLATEYRNSKTKGKIDTVALKSAIDELKGRNAFKKYGLGSEVDTKFKHHERSTFVATDQVEVPRDIKFFQQISLEPTFMEIPITWAKIPNSNYDQQSGIIVRIGIKCIPYQIDESTNLLSLIKDARLMGLMERLFKKSVRKVKVSNWFGLNRTKANSIHRGQEIDPTEAKNSVQYSPSPSELYNYKTLAKLYSSGSSSPWTTMIILSSFDFNDEDLVKTIKDYRKMTKYVIGDLVILNETKESASFCTVRTGSCLEIPFEYLKKVMNLDNILDYTTVSRQSKPFSKETGAMGSNINRAVSESSKVDNKKQMLKEIDEIIKRTNKRK